ncbi:MAG: hypothetical protein N2595_06630 [bacterium]|nr:hypothetical protein [bacterium]
MPVVRTVQVKCPCCKTVLVVNQETGEVVEERKPLVEKSSGDRLTDALRAHAEHRKKVAGLFSESIAGLSKKEEERRALFEEKLREARERGLDEGTELKDIDLD